MYFAKQEALIIESGERGSWTDKQTETKTERKVHRQDREGETGAEILRGTHGHREEQTGTE